MFRMRCAGCGVKRKVKFATWWFYFMQSVDKDDGPYFDLDCFNKAMKGKE